MDLCSLFVHPKKSQSFDKEKNMRDKTLISSLHSNTLSIGSWITLAHPAIAEIMAKSGFDLIGLRWILNIVLLQYVKQKSLFG